jgi:hypothetical protein
MSDEGAFKQTRRKITPDDLGDQPSAPFVNPLDRIREVQEAMGQESPERTPTPAARPMGVDMPFEVTGKHIPEEFKQALRQRGAGERLAPPDEDVPVRRLAPQQRQTPESRAKSEEGSDELAELLARISQHNDWEALELPSKGKFYDNIPEILHIRPMSGEEEQILATPRHVRKGKAIDMIFKNCIREKVDTSQLLTVDRTYLLIYLRGISYTPEYDVEVKCPECGQKHNTAINLDNLTVDGCPNAFSRESLMGVLPKTGFKFSYRLAVGEDEQTITKHREARIREYGDVGEDDTLTFRTALLLENIENVRSRQELGLLLKKLPIADVAHLRNVINDVPFGVNTEVGLVCPYCTAEFEIELPLEANFFFPRKKENRTRQ